MLNNAVKNRVPNFFIVGKPKAGTTALHYMLSQHPEVFMSPVKEPHHFHRDYIEEAERRHNGRFGLPYKNREDYLKLFTQVENEKVIGESSTGYIYSKRAAQEIAKFNPGAKILIVLREPVEFIHSLHSQFLRSGNEKEKNFHKALLLENRRRRGEDIPPTTAFSRNLFYSEHVKYCEQVERFLQAFGKSGVKIIIYEDMRKDNLAKYQEILEFLDIDTNFQPKLREVNPTKRVRFLKLATWAVYHGERKKGAMEQWAPKWLITSVRPLLSRLFYVNSRRKPLDPALKIALATRFKPEVLRLSDMLGIDLVKKWGYESH